MLVLTRQANQAIAIGEFGDIKISILKIKKNWVSLGITAPKCLPVYRAEIFQKNIFIDATGEGDLSC